jgi:SAM-dependent methyltransferase
MKRTAGYNNSVAYTAGYFQEQSPTFLNACLVMQRVAPPSVEKFTYCELGFGQGLTSLILAATHPDGTFYACDFNPVHVRAASAISDEARLSNLTLLENSFDDLAQGKVELPLFDYITLHGIVSWISDETRAQIMRFLTRYLKPGGVVQVSYNAMVGCAQVLPLQRLLMLGAGGGNAAWTQAAEFARKMVNLDALHFKRNPDSLGRVEGFDNQDERYLVHEYLHEKWTPFYFTDIVRKWLKRSSASPVARVSLTCHRWDGWLNSSGKCWRRSAIPSKLKSFVITSRTAGFARTSSYAEKRH